MSGGPAPFYVAIDEKGTSADQQQPTPARRHMDEYPSCTLARLLSVSHITWIAPFFSWS